MGHKVNPVGFRIGIHRNWNSRWFAEKKQYSNFLLEDIAIRKYLNNECKNALLSHIEIERKKKYDGSYEIVVMIFVARPGILLSDEGKNFARIKKELSKKIKNNLKIEIVVVKHPDLDAQIVAYSIAKELENRANFRLVQKRAIARIKNAGAKGCRTLIGGRLGGTDIARNEGYKDGIIPLHTIRSDIDFATVEAKTTYGNLGVKVWICRGDYGDNNLNKERQIINEKEIHQYHERISKNGGNKDVTTENN